MKVKVKVAQLCPTLFDPKDYSVHGILQARILERIGFPFSSGSSQSRDRTQVSHIAGRFITSLATREVASHISLIYGPVTLPTKVRLVKAMVFPVVMYGCESWTVKKAECQRVNAFELWCWRRLWRVPWTARRSNQCILKEISPGYSLEGLMLKLKLQNFGPLMQNFGKDPDAGKDWGQEEKGTTEDETVGWHHQLNGHRFGWTLGVGDEQGGLECCGSWGHKESNRTEQLNWLKITQGTLSLLLSGARQNHNYPQKTLKTKQIKKKTTLEPTRKDLWPLKTGTTRNHKETWVGGTDTQCSQIPHQ